MFGCVCAQVDGVYSVETPWGVTKCCGVLQRVAACCSVLQRVAACCRGLQWVAVSCSVLQWVAVSRSGFQWVPVGYGGADSHDVSFVQGEGFSSLESPWGCVTLCSETMIRTQIAPHCT